VKEMYSVKVMSWQHFLTDETIVFNDQPQLIYEDERFETFLKGNPLPITIICKTHGRDKIKPENETDMIKTIKRFFKKPSDVIGFDVFFKALKSTKRSECLILKQRKGALNYVFQRISGDITSYNNFNSLLGQYKGGETLFDDKITEDERAVLYYLWSEKFRELRGSMVPLYIKKGL
jgi:hypothetical protein